MQEYNINIVESSVENLKSHSEKILEFLDITNEKIMNIFGENYIIENNLKSQKDLMAWLEVNNNFFDLKLDRRSNLNLVDFSKFLKKENRWFYNTYLLCYKKNEEIIQK